MPMSESPENLSYDVVIIGAGTGGTALPRQTAALAT